MLNIVLYQPEIPQNTGNIGRTCVLTGSRLHLIKPLGFEISDRQIRRTGLDYWKDVDLELHENWSEFRSKYPHARIYAVTTKGNRRYDEVTFAPGDFLLFGQESKGLPDAVRHELSEGLVRVPMIESSTRSLNLSNTVAILAFEAMRQLGFPGMK